MADTSSVKGFGSDTFSTPRRVGQKTVYTWRICWRTGGNTMQDSGETVESVRVACKICLDEIPLSEAQIEEASDYVLYFCGLECYQIWRARANSDD